MSQEIINNQINKALTDWAVEFIRYRQQIADQKLKKSSGKGHQSFDHSVVKASGTQIAKAFFQFEAYLRIADMKKAWKKTPDIEALEEYIKSKGVDKFKSGYIKKHGETPIDVTKLINKIAWGIAVTVKKRGQLKKKRVRWYSKSYNQGIGVLYGRLFDALSKETLDQLKKELANVSTSG